MTTTTAPIVPDRLGDDIIRVNASEWFVRSRKAAPGAYWFVQSARGDVPICGCPAGRHILAGTLNRSALACHHFRAAVSFEIWRDRMAHPRPHMPAAPASHFVD